jgi:hypothetical protein
MMTIGISKSDSSWSNPAEELCDELMCHIFECESCINGSEERCSVFRSLKVQIAKAGGPIKSILLTM